MLTDKKSILNAPDYPGAYKLKAGYTMNKSKFIGLLKKIMKNIYLKKYQHLICPAGFMPWSKTVTLGLLFFLSVTGAFAQEEHVLSGKVTGVSDKSGIPGVSILIKGTTNGTTTDANGDYSIKVKSSDVIIVSFIGYTSEEVAVGNQTQLDVALSESISQLSEVVVVGYGVQEKKLITGATVQVKGEDLVRMSTVSPMIALQSQTPGVNITKMSGEPGAGFKVNIRGLGTIGNSQPLYVVDGVIRGDINYLNPADIQSIDVLKDAASAAIYGSRAANGVVLVTTKRGKKNQKMELTYNAYYGAQNLYKKLPMLNAKEYMAIMDEAQVNSGLSPVNWRTQLAPGEYDAIQNGTFNGTDWLGEISKKNAPIQSHAINIAGGSESSIYSAGVSYTSQQGIFGYPVQSKYDRYTFRLNSEHTILKSASKEFDLLKIGQNLTYSYTENNSIHTGNMYYNDIYNAIAQDPLLPMWADDKTDPAYPYHSPIPWNPLASNPAGNMVYGSGNNKNKSHNLYSNFYFEIQPIKGLVYRSSFAVSPFFSSFRSFNPIRDLGSNANVTVNGVTQNMSGGMGWLYTNTLNYKFALQGNHHFDVLAGQSAERWGLGESLSTTNNNSTFQDFQHAYIDNANINSTASIGGGPVGTGKGGLLSYFGRINYDFKDTYLLSLVVRRDGSSNFAPGHRWGVFPSISAGWVVTNERFAEPFKKYVDFLKIRASWGQNGNQAIQPYQDQTYITFNNPLAGNYSNYYFGAAKTTPSVGAFPYNIPNANAKWETSEQTDIGLDATFFNGKVSLAADYYVKNTRDWLVAVQVPATWGVSINGRPYINGGDIQNKGLELALGVHDRIGSDFTFNVNGNIAFNHNEVTKINNGLNYIPATGVNLWGNGTYIARAQVGYPIGYFWGYKTAGIFQNEAEIQNYKDKEGNLLQPDAKPGDVKFVDTNGKDGITEDDKVQIGNPNPKFTFGLNLQVGFKGFDLAVTTYGVNGNQIATGWHDAGAGANNYTTAILGRWHGEGTSNTIPRVTTGGSINQKWNSDLSIQNGSYYRISNVTLGYDFKKLLKTLPIGQLRLFVTAQNLFTFTKYTGMDPEIGTSTGGEDNQNNPDPSKYTGWTKGIDLGFYPNPRTFMVGVSAKF